MEPIDPRVLDELEKTNPELVTNYRNKMASSNTAMNNARTMQDYGAYANVAGRAMNDLHNSQKRDVILKNRFEDMGRAPTIKEADRPKYDDSMINNLTSQGVNRAKEDYAKANDEFFTEDKLAQASKQRGKDDEAYKHKKEAQDRLNDPNSEDSKLAQELAKQLMPGRDFSGKSAAQLQGAMPTMEKLWQMKNPKSQGGFPYEMKLDTFGRTVIHDKRTGQIVGGGSQGAPQGGQDEGDEAPLQPTPGESKQEFNARIKQKYEKDKAPSGTQSTAAGFGRRIEQAEAEFADIAKTGYDRTDISSGIGAELPNLVRSSEAVRQDQAERNFINAVLRRESGAAIAPSEFESAEEQYFPRVGDDEASLAQKERNRKQVLESMKAEAAGAWDKTPSVMEQEKAPKEPGPKQPVGHGKDLP